jgi:pseudaminic acid synthase
MKDIQIPGFSIGESFPPFIVAEMSGNHNQSLARALAIVEAAAAAGAHALKLQTYTADTMTIRGAFTITDENSLWKGKELFDLYQEAYTPWEWHKPLFDRAIELGMIPFSSPFDETAVDFLETLQPALYKIASFENTDIPLLKKVAATGKPVIMSTGASTLSEIDEGVRTLRANGCQDLILLKCTSTYPAHPGDSNIRTIPELSRIFHCHAGLSDHTFGMGVAIASVALGARVIEKHFTLSRADGGVDAAFSMEPPEMKALVEESFRAFLGLGEMQFGIQKTEEKNRQFKRSLFAGKDIMPGDTFSNDNVRVIRPGLGLEPKFLELITGKTARNFIEKGKPIQWENL